MPHISPTTYKFACDTFRSVVEELLDDPSGLLHPWREEEPQEVFAEFREIATDLGLNFDELVDKGHEFQIRRLRDIESGAMKPSPREKIDKIGEGDMRSLILARLEEIRTTFGRDRFGKPNKKGKLPFMAYYPEDFDFSNLPDAELLEHFEKVVRLSYSQR